MDEKGAEEPCSAGTPTGLGRGSSAEAAPVGDQLSALSCELEGPRQDVASHSVEGPRMSPVGSPHEPVLLAEVVALAEGLPAGLLADLTVGAGGHAAALLDAERERELVGIDRDQEALRIAALRLAPFGSRCRLVHATFDQVSEVLRGERVALALADLGMSSMQVDDARRGFSYRFDGPLDMRMDQGSGGPTAKDLVGSLGEAELAALLRAGGEDRFARRIARALVAARPIETTGELAEVVRRALPATVRAHRHPEARTFQALRIAVNDELGMLERALRALVDLLVPGGVIAVLTYHSGEDRLTKAVLRQAATTGCHCPLGPSCRCEARPVLEARLGVRRPGPEEVAANPRAASAHLRFGRRLSESRADG